MKTNNVIPLIVAIVLGSAAAFAVSRLIRPGDADSESQYTYVVAAARPITPKDDAIKESWLMKRKVEVSSMPVKAIPWTQMIKCIYNRLEKNICEKFKLILQTIKHEDYERFGKSIDLLLS